MICALWDTHSSNTIAEHDNEPDVLALVLSGIQKRIVLPVELPTRGEALFIDNVPITKTRHPEPQRWIRREALMKINPVLCGKPLRVGFLDSSE